MSTIYNIPFSYNFINTFIEHITNDVKTLYDLENVLVVFPNKRFQKEFHKKIHIHAKNKIIFIPKTITYSDLSENIIEFLSFSKKSATASIIKHCKPKVLEKFELYTLLKVIVRQIENEKKIPITTIAKVPILSIMKAISEYYYYEYNIVDIGNDFAPDTEIFLLEIILKLENYLKENNFTLKQKLQNLFSKILEDNWNYTSEKKIYAILPLNDVKYILRFLKILSNYKNATIFIRGLDKGLSDVIWAQLNDKHHQYYIKNFLHFIELERKDIKDLNTPNQLDRFCSYIGYPSANLYCLQNQDVSIPKHIEIIEAQNQCDEARLIAAAIREQFPFYEKIAIVTRDKILSKKIKHQLSTWHIAVDDFILTSILEESEAKLFLIILEYFYTHDNKITLFLDILKHPLSKIRICYEELLCDFELKFLRNTPQQNSIRNYFLNMNEVEKREFNSIIQAAFLLDECKKVVNSSEKISEIFDLHVKVLDFFLVDNDKSSETVTKIKALNKSFSSTQLLRHNFKFEDYKELIIFLLSRIKSSNNKENQKVKILEIMESRFLNFDLVFLVGANDGIFPKYNEDHGLISSLSREKSGIRNISSELGYDESTFLGLIANKKFFISYSKTLKNTTLRSRYLERLILSFKLSKMKPKFNTKYKTWLYNQAKSIRINPIKRPAPNPILNARQDKISITGIEYLMANPYVYYLRYILKLLPLEDIIHTPSNREFGILFHQTIAKIMNNKITDKAFLIEKFLDLLSQEINKSVFNYSIKNFWLKRFSKIIQSLTEDSLFNNNLINKIFVETKGVFELNIDGKKIIITAIADRINILNNSIIQIIDYKTGYVPTNQEVLDGKYPQLIIEELLLKQGILEELKYNNENVELYYVQIKGKKEQTCKKIKITSEIKDVASGLETLLKKFLCQKSEFFALPADNFKVIPYSNLLRVDEWFIM